LEILFSLLQWLNYAIPAFMYVFKLPASVLAGKRKKTIAWAIVLKINFVSALAFWGFGIFLTCVETFGEKRGNW